MALSTYFDVKSLTKAVLAQLDSLEVVSFDMFDTLLVRRVHDPDLVKLPVARYISALARRQDIKIDWRQVQKKRDQIEQALRAKTGETHADHEAHYPTFMQQLLQHIFEDSYGPELLQQVTDYELKMENSMLVPRAEMLELLQQVKAVGKKVLVISDMYLPTTHLKVLLEHAGMLSCVDEIHSSADSFKAKASGEGYVLIQNQHQIEPAKWLHIGDNMISDGLRASQHGIRAFVIDDPEEKRRYALGARQYFYSQTRQFWLGRMLQQIMAPIESENVEQDALYVEGYNFFGPILSFFVHQIAEQCRQKKISKLYFLSREGWVLKQIWDNITPLLYPQGNLPEVEYLYVSRMALAGASCAYQGLDEKNANIVFLPPGNKDFTDIARIFGLQLEPLEPHLSRHGLNQHTVLSGAHKGYHFENRIRFAELLQDDEFQDEIKRQSLQANKALQLYLQDKGFFVQDDVAVVDIGWLGTIQHLLNRSISHRIDKPKIQGMLFGASRGIDYGETEDNSWQGLFYDHARFDIAASSILYARDLFEEACRAPHPSLMQYKLVGENSHEQTYELVFRVTNDELGQAESNQDKFYQPLQQGIFAAAHRYGAAAAIVAHEPEPLRYWFNQVMVMKLGFPSIKEIKTIRYQSHLDDFHGKNKPKGRRRPQLLMNSWEQRGWRLFWAKLFRTAYYRKHVRHTVNSY